MARRYDSQTTIFSPEGRLYQVEYAMEAISHAGAAIGILAENGVVLATEKRVSSKLLSKTKKSEKMYLLSDHIACAVAGITADANTLIDFTRLEAGRYFYRYQEPIPVESLVRLVCDQKQGYTQYGGLRPFGVSFLYAGWDSQYGFQLYHSDPSGNYSGWQAYAIGAKNQSAQSILKQEYKAGLTTDEALHLAVRVLRKTLDSTALNSEKLEFAILSLVDGKPSFSELSPASVDSLISSVLQEDVSSDDDSK